MGNILFGNQSNKVVSYASWIFILLGVSQLADIAAYYGHTEIQNLFITLVATPVIAIFCFALFRVIIPIRKPIEISSDNEEETSLGVLAVHGYDNQTHYINLDNDPIKILKGLKEVGYQDFGFWKEINLTFCRAPFKGNHRYNGLRLFTVEKMRSTKPIEQI